MELQARGVSSEHACLLAVSYAARCVCVSVYSMCVVDMCVCVRVCVCECVHVCVYVRTVGFQSARLCSCSRNRML